MMYAGAFFVDNAEKAKISFLNCGLNPFRNGKVFFEILALSSFLNFGLVYFLEDLLYNIDKKSLFFTSLVDFPIDRFLQQFNVETSCCNLGTNFSP